jgi:transmembrane protein EpsG
MLIWFSFIFISLIICYTSTIFNKNRTLALSLKFSLIAFISLFAGFRDGLGQDYSHYDLALNNFSTSFFVLDFKEPLYLFFTFLVSSTKFSSVLFFLVFALLTNYIFINYFYQFKSVFYILFIYLTSGYFFGSFNLVRQVAAAAIFLYSTKYIERQVFWKYGLLIVLASSIHLSAIFLLLFYYLGKIQFSKYIALFFVVLSFFFGWVYKVDLESFFPSSNFYYDYYLDRDEAHEGNGFFIYLFNITLILVILGKNYFQNNKNYTVIFNFAVIGVILYNLSGSFYFFFRFAVYFHIFILLISSMLIYLYNSKVIKVALIFLYSFVFIYFLVVNQNEPKIVPHKIKSINEIFDN